MGTPPILDVVVGIFLRDSLDESIT